MWEFRRDPTSLTAAERAPLEQLFDRLPALRALHELRVRFRAIFDTAGNRREARRRLTALFLEALTACPALEKFVCTYERWQDAILAYFDDGRTSGVVEGINNKARVITKRAYGLKAASSLWARLVLDLNRAHEAVRYTISTLHALAAQLRAAFSMVCS